MNMFEVATRKKLRFETPAGMITVEDLWDLPLDGKRLSLDSLAVALHKKVNDDSAVSFVSKKTVDETDTKLRFDIVLHILSIKLAERDQRKEAADRAQKKQRIAEILDQKREQALVNKSEEELLQMLAEL